MSLFQSRVKYDIIGGPGFSAFTNHFINYFERKYKEMNFTLRTPNSQSSKIKFGPTVIKVLLSGFDLEDNSCERFMFRGTAGDNNRPIQGYYNTKTSFGTIEFD